MSSDRRINDRLVPNYQVDVYRMDPPGLISSTEIINVSSSGVAFFGYTMLAPGELLRFECAGDRSPVIAEVLGCERLLNGMLRVRCHVTQGKFDLDAASPPAESHPAA